MPQAAHPGGENKEPHYFLSDPPLSYPKSKATQDSRAAGGTTDQCPDRSSLCLGLGVGISLSSHCLPVLCSGPETGPCTELPHPGRYGQRVLSLHLCYYTLSYSVDFPHCSMVSLCLAAAPPWKWFSPMVSGGHQPRARKGKLWGEGGRRLRTPSLLHM